jgi:hypothetical protein
MKLDYFTLFLHFYSLLDIVGRCFLQIKEKKKGRISLILEITLFSFFFFLKKNLNNLGYKSRVGVMVFPFNKFQLVRA